MDSFSSDYSQEKKTLAEEKTYRRKTLIRIATIASAAILLLLIAVIFSAIILSNKFGSKSNRIGANSTIFDSLKAVCSSTLYPESCYNSISSASGKNTTVYNPEEIFQLSVQVALAAVSKASSVSDEISDGEVNLDAKMALRDCKEFFVSAADHLNESLVILQDAANMDDIRSLLSAAITDHSTCIEILRATPTALSMAPSMTNTTEYTSNSLAIATKYGNYIISAEHNPLIKPKLFVPLENSPPLLNSEGEKLKPNLTVAKDGTGDFVSIRDAVEKVPENSLNLFVIYVKEGLYEENVLVSRSKWNVVMLGDGMNRTIVAGSRIGVRTSYKSATFVVEGRRFTAMDMSFKNTAGSEKNQTAGSEKNQTAVSLLSKSDRSIFIRCSFHNTVYTHSLRQFFLNCNIFGSNDFLYGNAAVIFQNCTIRPELSISGQNNTISAQTRSDPNQNTGTVIRNSVISGLGDLSAATMYLGRPGGKYSRTIVMMTEIGDVVKPEGWVDTVSGTVPADTIFFGEYRNSGNGSRLAGRVTWPGYQPKMSDEEAEDFSVDSFIQGKSWINV